MSLRIATTQLSASEYGLQKIKLYLTLADEQKVDIICFPEGYLNGYTRNEYEAKKRALDLSSHMFARILTELKKFRVTAIIGVIEVENDHLFNTAVVIQGGQLRGKYRKAHPQEGIFRAGSDYPVFTVKGHTFGINICYDANFLEATQRLVERGAEIVFYPLNNELSNESAEKWRYKHIENLMRRARDANIIAVSSDVIIETDSTVSYGCTAIVGGDGRVVAKAHELQESFLIKELP